VLCSLLSLFFFVLSSLLEFYVPTHHSANEASLILDELLAHFPEAASVPNQEGRLPLQLAITTGHLYDKTVKSILYAFPQALGSVDKKTQLFPFMMAAAAAAAEDVNEPQSKIETQESLEQLNTIYSLLKDDPSLIICKKVLKRGKKRKHC